METHRAFIGGFLYIIVGCTKEKRMQFTIIIAVFMALLAGENANSSPQDQLPWMSGHFSGFSAVSFTMGTILLLWSLMRAISQMFLRRMERVGMPDRTSLRLPGRIDLLTRTIIIVTFATQLTIGGWGYLAGVQWHLRRVVLADEIVLLGPFIVMLIMKWHCFYPINRYVREYVVAGQLAEGLSARPVWTRRQYVSFQIRHGLLIILVPLMLMLALKDVVCLFVDNLFPAEEAAGNFVSYAGEIIIAAGAAVIFIFSPLLLRRIWLTRTLPDGPLRTRLEEFCRKIKLSYRDILLWDTYSAVANAAVMGLIRRIRYVMLSDNLIENMSDEQIEAVFAHEAGHIKHHHIMFMVMCIVGAGSVTFLLLRGMEDLLNETAVTEQLPGKYGAWFIDGAGVLLMISWILLFGWVSRRFERQADLHAAMAVDPQDEHKTLGEHGAYIMGSTLQRIAFLNGIATETRSWRHSSIASRRDFLYHLSAQPKKLRRFCKIILWIKILIILSVTVGVVGWALE